VESPVNADRKVVEATIQVGGETVEYRRAGTGAPVLLLQATPPGHTKGGADTETEPFSALARSHRVFQPITPIPLSQDAAERWLQGVVEGLGLITPDVVADPELAPALARLVGEKGGFVGRVVFLAGKGQAGDLWSGL